MKHCAMACPSFGDIAAETGIAAETEHDVYTSDCIMMCSSGTWHDTTHCRQLASFAL